MTEPPILDSPEEEAPGFFSRIRSNVGYISFLFATVGVVALLGGGVAYLFIDEIRGFSLTVVTIGATLLLLALGLSFRQVTVALTGRRGRYGFNTLAMTAAFVGIAILVNLLAFRNDTRIDVTYTREFSLAPQTAKLLKNLEESVRATAFFPPSTSPEVQQLRDISEDLLTEYDRRSTKFEFRFIDPDLRPDEARRLGINQSPAIVFEATDSGRIYQIAGPVEQEFTTALLVVTGVEQKRVYYLTGHGEPSITDPDDPTGYSIAARGIVGDNYRLVPLSLLDERQRGWPEDAAALVVVRPEKDLLQQEKDILHNYLRGGGEALFLVETDTPAAFKEILGRWGIALGEGVIVDAASHISDEDRTPILQRFSYVNETEITPDLAQTFFPDSTSVDPVVDLEELQSKILVSALGFTSFDSWLETDPEVNEFDEATDTPGPFAIGVALRAIAPLDEEPLPSDGQPDLTSIVIIGDSDFANNRFFTSLSNGDLFLNSINWLAEDFELISIRPKPSPFRELVLTTREFRFIRWSSWLLMPLAVLALGGAVWWRRR